MGLQKKLKGRGVSADQVVGVRTLEADREIEELQKRNAELEQQIKVIKCVLPSKRAIVPICSLYNFF